MNKIYLKALRAKLIRDYVGENNASPNKHQLTELLRDALLERPTLEEVGFCGTDVTCPGFRGESSSAVENTNREAFDTDISVLHERLDVLSTQLEDSFRGLRATTDRAMKLLRGIEKQVDNMVLSEDGEDLFTYGISESFDTHEFVDHSRTTASVESGYVTVRRNDYSLFSLEDTAFSVSHFGDGISSAASLHPLTNLKEKDGRVWEYHIQTTNISGLVGCALDLDLKEPDGVEISDVRVTGVPVSANSKTYGLLYYSVDGQSYATKDSTGRVLEHGENLFGLGETVKKLRLVLYKDAADSILGNSGEYVFGLDVIELLTSRYDVSRESVIYLGPYEVVNEYGEPVYFSLLSAKDGVCTRCPDKTSVNLFVSKDDETWYHAAYSGSTGSIVSFSKTDSSSSGEFVEGSSHRDSLVGTPPPNIDLRNGTEALCNLYIPDSEVPKFQQRTLLLKRDTPQDEVRTYGAPSGWTLDRATGTYACVFRLEHPGGRVIDLGSSTAEVDGRQVTGSVHVSEGWHRFSTNAKNWREVESGLLNLNELKTKDPLYPHNHKLLIEGYGYLAGFVGDQVYTGSDEYYGRWMEYVTPERFGESDGNLSVYTVENYDGSLYIKVKVDPSDASWHSERIAVGYVQQADESNRLYVRLDLVTMDDRVSPVVNSFKLRVI
jgi:hypothetical protein